MSGPALGLTVIRPADGSVFAPGQAIDTAGRAHGIGGLEQGGVGAVSISVDGGAPVPADLRQVPNQPVPTVSWTASVRAPAEPRPHQILVAAVADNSVTKVTQTAGIVVQSQQAPADGSDAQAEPGGLGNQPESAEAARRAAALAAIAFERVSEVIGDTRTADNREGA